MQVVQRWRINKGYSKCKQVQWKASVNQRQIKSDDI